MIDIECLARRKTVKLPQFVNTDNYDGQVVCQECKSLLQLKLVKEKLLKYRVVEKQFKSKSPAITHVETVLDYGKKGKP